MSAELIRRVGRTRSGRAQPPSRGRFLSQISPRTGAALFLAEIVVVLGLWQLLVGVFQIINPLFLPAPSAIVQGFFELIANGRLAENVMPSLTAWVIGYGAATVVAAFWGLIAGSSIAADRLTLPILWTFYATPMVAYQPLTKAWFGFGLKPVIALVFIAALFPILFNTSTGVRTTNRSLLNAGRIFGASKKQLYWKILLPSTIPYTIVGMRQSAVLATVGLIIAEMASSSGLGYLIAFTASRYQTAQTFAVIALVVIWSLGITQLVRLVGRRISPGMWQGK